MGLISWTITSHWFGVREKNHPSATPGNVHYEAVKSQALHEISEGNYVLCDEKPVLISPLGAVSKSDDGVRLIHDCSRPTGNCVNVYASLNESQQFQTIDDATSLLQRGYFMAKVDLKGNMNNPRLVSTLYRVYVPTSMYKIKKIKKIY